MKLDLEEELKKLIISNTYKNIEYKSIKRLDGRIYLKVVCNIHGEFTQRLDSCKEGRNCQKCSNIESGRCRKPQIEVVENRLEELFGNKYIFDLGGYVNSKSKIVGYCSQHGYFSKTYVNIITSKGCNECSKDVTYKTKSKNILNKKFEGLVQPEEYKLIPLTQERIALVDNEDFDSLKDINWYFENGYADSNSLGKMHRIINKTPDDMFTDHINGDKLDNRRENLRTCTIQQNSFNTKPKIGASSKYKGVSFHKQSCKWTSKISFKNKSLHLGYFKTEAEAKNAYNEKAKDLFGEFAYLN